MTGKLYSPARIRFFTLFIVVCLLSVAVVAPAQAQQSHKAFAAAEATLSDSPLTPEVSTSAPAKIAPALRDIKTTISPSAMVRKGKQEGLTSRPIPRPNGIYKTGPDGHGDHTQIFKAPVQASPNTPAPSVGLARSFDGLDFVTDDGLGFSYAPPDTDGAVGPNHYVQTVNTIYAVYDKNTGALLGGPYANNALWVAASTGDACEAQNDGDPVVMYDQLADRWVLSQFALPNFPSGPYYECIAVSKTGDPLGAWWLYTFKTSNTNMGDYPKLAVWPDGYYMSTNQFKSNATAWGGTGAFAFESAQMQIGGTATMVYFNNSTDNIGGLLPSNLQGSATPPANEPNYFVQAADNAWGYTATDQLRVWKFTVNWASPGSSTFKVVKNLNTDAFDTNMCNYSRDCIAQPGTTQRLDAISDRLMYLLQYRNFGDHQSMVVNQTVDMGGDHAGIRWYELRNTGSGWSIYQQGDYAPDSDQRWVGSASIDSVGNIALGYSVSSSTTYPSVRFTGRLVGDPLGDMTQDENSIVAGTGSQLNVNRWGDYSAMMVDPVDECTFWYTQEYVKDTGDYNWATRIASFKLPGCGVAWGTLSGTVTDGANPIEGAVVTVTGGASAVTDVNGDYSFDGLPAGSYDMDVTAYGFIATSASAVAVSDGNATDKDFTMTAKSMSTVSGTVTNSTTAAPLSALIYIPEYPNSPIASDPNTGAYSVNLEYGTTHNFTVVAEGYSIGTAAITPATPTITQDFALDLDLAACTASGYAFNYGFSQNFNPARFPPAGWAVSDVAHKGVKWYQNTVWGDGNYTGGNGKAADVNSDTSGPRPYDTYLTSPSILVADLPAQLLTYKANYQNYFNLDFLDLQIKTDSDPWATVLSWNEDHGAFKSTPAENVAIDLSSYLAGKTSFQLRWHYYDPFAGNDWDWYAQIDDVAIGDCLPTTALTYTSSAAEDGWVLEKAETANIGKNIDSVDTSVRVGDFTGDKQYKSILSFDTSSIPDGATIGRVRLVINIEEFVGDNMFTPTKTHGNMLVDINNLFFGTGVGLESVDFQSSASKAGVGKLKSAPTTGLYTIMLKSKAFSFINDTGTTQLRMAFTLDDNDDMSADYIKITSGDGSSDQPQLIVEYFP